MPEKFPGLSRNGLQLFKDNVQGEEWLYWKHESLNLPGHGRGLSTSRSLSSDIAEVISNAGNPSKRSHDTCLSISDLEDDQSPTQKVPWGASTTDNKSVHLSTDSLFPTGSENDNGNDSEKPNKTVESNFLESIATEYDLDEACASDVDPKLAKIIYKMIQTKLLNKLNDQLSKCSRPATMKQGLKSTLKSSLKLGGVEAWSSKDSKT